MSFLCNIITKDNSTFKSVLYFLFLVTLIKKQSSPAIKPITNQGLSFILFLLSPFVRVRACEKKNYHILDTFKDNLFSTKEGGGTIYGAADWSLNLDTRYTLHWAPFGEKKAIITSFSYSNNKFLFIFKIFILFFVII